MRCLESRLDAKLSDAGFSTQTSFLRRSLVFGDGILNLELHQDDATGIAVANFHRSSSEYGDLQSWLGLTEEMTARAADLFGNTLGLALEGDEA